MNLKKTILLVFFITNFSTAQDSFPKYREVINRLFLEYDMTELDKDNEVILEKRNTGWSVKTTNPKDTIQQLYWNKTANQFEKINLPEVPAAISVSKISEYKEREENEEELKKRMLNEYPELSYDIFPLYGYEGCYIDNIKLIESKTELNDNEIYILGYSYSQLASNLINDNYEFSLRNLKYDLPFTKNSMNQNQLDNFLNYSKKSIDYYKNLIQKNPNYNTIPGSIGIKFCNEIVSLFLNLYIYQNDEIALNYLLQNNLYSENINQYSKLMLDSCEPNSILFTAGDNDTFPLLYYQLKNNYRKDILIINTSLLNDPRYSIMMKNGFYYNNNITYSLNDEFIKSEYSAYALLNSNDENTIDITTLNKIKDASETTINLESNNFRFKKNRKSISWVFDSEVLYRNQMLMLDIIAQNNWNRPIYFTDYNSYNEYLGLNNYLQFEGLVYKLTSDENKKTEDIGYIKNDKIIEKVLNQIEFKNINKLPVEEKVIIDYIRNIYLRLAKYYFEKKLYPEAKLTLNNCLEKYNNKISPLNFYSLEFVDLYITLNEKAKSDSIKNDVLKNLENKNHIYYYKTDEYVNEKLSSHKKYIENTYN